MKHLILLFFGCLLIGTANGQATLQDSVMHKLQGDKRAYENFVALGKLYTIDALLSNTDNYFQCSSTLYNSFDPFCRLIDSDSLKAFYKEIIISFDLQYHNSTAAKHDETHSFFHDKLVEIENFWRKGKTMKQYYQKFVARKPFRTDLEADEFQSQMRQYLKSYFIVIDFK